MKPLKALSVTLLVALISSPAMAADDLLDTVRKGCANELSTYCANVKPGHGRVLACFYAHEDKLSGSCEYALYDAAAQLERFVSALTYVANECDADLEKHCADVAIGKGRVARCLLDNKAKLSQRCAKAVDVTELKVE